MKFKKITVALLAGMLLSFSTAGTCFAYTGEDTEAVKATTAVNASEIAETKASAKTSESAEATAAEGVSETSAAENAEVTQETQEEAADTTDLGAVPYDIIANEDGTYTFRFGDYEWSYDPNEELESEKVGTVTGVRSYLHLRSGAGLDYEIIGHLLPGAQVEVVGEEGDWYKVTIPEQTGYVYGDYLSVAEHGASGDSEMNEELLSMLLAMMVQSKQQVSTSSGLTPDGNLTLVDDIGSTTGAGQQFITLVTKNGNTFYLVIDRDDDGNENVHFMNLVDEADLFALLDEDAQSEYTEAHQSATDEEPEETETEAAGADEAETEVKTEKQSNWAPLMLLTIAAIGGISYTGYRYITKKKKAEAADKPDPDADYHDEDDEEYDIPEEDDYEDDEPDEEEKYPEDEQAEVTDDSNEDE